MNSIKGQKLLTIHLSPGDVYEIDYVNNVEINIINQSSDVITLSACANCTENDSVSQYVELPAYAFLNDFRLDSSKLYITASGYGNVSLYRI
ncbi:MAG: hypothetical protein ACI4DP_06775 [Candidatus Ornithomonoglobus sp.]